MPVVLGINAFHAGASAALVVDGKPVAAIAEERLNRIKYFAKFPAMAVAACLDMAGITFREVDYVALACDMKANWPQKIGYSLRNLHRVHNFVGLFRKRHAAMDVRSIMATECGVEISHLRFRQFNIEHHLAHTASAYFISATEQSAGFTMDGSGDFVTCMLSECVGDRIHVKTKIYVPHSLGTLYTMVCDFIGYEKYGDEGKVMGLASYGDDSYHTHFQDMAFLTSGGFRLNTNYFMPLGSDQGFSYEENGQVLLPRHYSKYMTQLFGPRREPYTELTQRDKDLAMGVQRRFEDCYIHMLNVLYKQVPGDHVAMAGGSVLNSVANGKIFASTPFRQTTIQPAAGDEGNALGAALYVSRAILGEKYRYVMVNPYLGPEYSDAAIKASLEFHNVPYMRLNQEAILEAAASLIAAGNIVGWFQGRMEWGPRALGNRSILANPSLSSMKETLNSRIKRREWFRPFAPSVLAERQAEIFEHGHPSPFMLHVYKIKASWRQRLVAVNHVDDTGRLQTVSRDENALYYELIRKFEQKTGVPALLNTSFNENEPIVCSPDDAIDCFLRTRMDALFIGSFMCRKDSQT